MMDIFQFHQLRESNRKEGLKVERLKLEIEKDHAVAMKWLAFFTPPFLIFVTIVYLFTQ